MDWSAHYARRAARMDAAEVRELLGVLNRKDVISFAGGIPDPALFPTAEVAAAYARVLADPARAGAALQYGIPEGYTPLRQWLADDMTRRGTPCTVENVLVTNGSQQALDFLGKLFVSDGETILIGRPTFLGAIQAFNAYEPRYDELPGPGSNRGIESFATARPDRPKFGYVMPEFENPTGRTLTRAEREQLLDFADTLDIPLAEDSPYETLRYEGEPVPLLITLAAARAGGIDSCRVIHCGTFSKSIAPGLRIGWMIGPRAVIDRLVLVKQASDIQTSTINQMVLTEVAPMLVATQAAKVQPVYRARRDAMLAALRRHMPQGVQWTEPDGGFFIWVTLPPRIDTGPLLRRSVEQAKVAFVPGSAFFPDDAGRNMLRLSFSLADEAKTNQGIAALAALVRAELAA